MKKTVLSVVLGASTLALTACGGGDNDTPPSTATPTVNPSPIVNPSPTVNTSPTQTTSTSKVTGTYDLWSQEYIDDSKKELGASAISTPAVTINGAAHGTTLELAKLAQGLNNLTVNLTSNATIGGQAHTVKVNETYRVYHQPNSVVLGRKFDGATVSGANLNKTFSPDFELDAAGIRGNATKALPTTGVFNYNGKSFDHDSEGSFDYAIDFAKKTGKGNIALDGKSITLNESVVGNIAQRNGNMVNFQGFGVRGQTSGINGSYTLGIFGDNAEEVAGFMDGQGTTIGFGGIKK